MQFDSIKLDSEHHIEPFESWDETKVCALLVRTNSGKGLCDIPPVEPEALISESNQRLVCILQVETLK